jgi:heme/copper-type cytochrome/quinol oxidase subunit 3
VLVVAYLAVGELLLVLPGRTVTRLAAATMLFLTFAATAAVLAARIDTGELARAGATPPNGALKGPWPTVMAIALNSAGTLVLLAGSILSARRRRDPRPLLVAAGVLVIALASTATRLGSYTLFALAQAAGVTLILLGLVTRRRSSG